jgi:hypothetical protein
LFFFVLVLSGAFQVFAKSFSSAIMIIVSKKFFFAYMVLDHVLYQVYRVARCDHTFFMTGRHGPCATLFFSVSARFMEKLAADFSGCWNVRMPISMGGAYFLFNQLTAHASVFAAVKLYEDYGLNHLPARVLWIGAGSIFAAWAATFLAAVSLAKREYRYVFYSTGTAVDEARMNFFSDTDEGKMAVFDFHICKWRRYAAEMKAFTHANWARWKRESPAWFTEELIARVPDEFIPVADLAALNAAADGGQRRRSSFGLVESVRRDSKRSSQGQVQPVS